MPIHILVVDDEQTIRDLLSQFLQAKGCQVTATASAKDALQILEASQPDLVICDISMDESDGLALIDRMREVNAQVPILILSGMFFDAQVLREKLLTCASGFVSKTASLQDIFKEVQRLTGAA